MRAGGGRILFKALRNSLRSPSYWAGAHAGEVDFEDGGVKAAGFDREKGILKSSRRIIYVKPNLQKCFFQNERQHGSIFND